MTSEATLEVVEIEDARSRLRELGTEIDVITRMPDGRWLCATAGRHRVEVIEHDDATAIRRAREAVESAYAPKQMAWLAAFPTRIRRRRR